MNNATHGDADDHRGSPPILKMLELAEARKLTWLKEGSSTIQQQALRDLNQAFQNWWKRPDHFGHPIWPKAGINEGFVIRDLSIRRLNRKWGQAFIPKCGWVKFRVTCEWRDIETALSARVTKDRAGRWFVSFTRLAPQIEREPTGEIVGLDMGVTHTVATSKGKFLDMKLLTNRERQPKRRLQRKLARQTKGSNRRNATKLAISKGDRSTQRLDRVDHDLIALEDLGVKGHDPFDHGHGQEPRQERCSEVRTQQVYPRTGLGYVPQTAH